MARRLEAPEPQFSGLFSLTFLSVLALVLVVGLGGRRVLSTLGFGAEARPREVAPGGSLDAEERATVALFEGVSPAVVYIESLQLQGDPWRGIPPGESEGSGSGFVWDEEGHVVTNLHVVPGGSRPIVRLHDGTAYEARVIGTAPDYDLAVLSIDAPRERLRPIPLGRSSELRVGQRAFAVGYPFGLEQTLTTGIVSGLNRAIQSQSKLAIHGVIQTDAAINPGNSGGPLLDGRGRLIGVNTAIATPTGANSGVGFAVPIDTVNRIVPRILTEGTVQRAGLGINLGRDLWARDRGLTGAVIRDVLPSSPAGRAGLVGVRIGPDGEVTLGDIIVAVDEQEIRGEEDLYQALEPYRAGDEVLLGLDRSREGGRQRAEVRVRLAPLR